MEFIRPNANIVFSIGAGLISDFNAAVLELVKNSYDADAENVYVRIIRNNEAISKVIVEDDGHGMTKEIIKKNWLVPGYSNKMFEKYSRGKQRRVLGNKGLGRFGVNYIGGNILLKSTTIRESNVLEINWADFSHDKYLDEVEIEIKSSVLDLKQGTTVTITDINESEETFDIEKLSSALRKLVYPLSDDIFNILFEVVNTDSDDTQLVLIEPISRQSILSLFQYKLHGEIVLRDNNINPIVYFDYYDNNRAIVTKPLENFTLPQNLDLKAGFKFELNYFERGAKDIDFLLELSKNIEDFNFINKTEIRTFLNSIIGVGIYRNKFRISPYGDHDFDWLELDKKRVQNTRLIAMNNTFGEVFIEDEEISGLVEKSARDGLQKNKQFDTLKFIIEELYSRFAVEKNSEKEEDIKEPTLEFLPAFKDYDIKKVNNRISNYISKTNIDAEKLNEIKIILDQTETQYHRMTNILAVYEKEISLGFLVDYVIHEIQNPSFKINDSFMNILDDASINTDCYELFSSDLDIIKRSIDSISDLGNFLRPLASTKKKRVEINLFERVEKIKDVFNDKLVEGNIEVINEINEKLMLEVFEGHFDQILINLIDNSIYWLNRVNYDKKIYITNIEDTDYVYIIYSNNGPAISDAILKYNLLFEPGWSEKTGGTGLGLTIVGHNMALNNGNISVVDIDNDMNVNFELKFKKKGRKGK